MVNAEEELENIDKKLATVKNETIKQKLLNKRESVYLQSITGNIEKFSGIEGTEQAIENLKKVKLNKNIYKRMQANKLFAEISIPILFMGYIIPKSVYALTASTRNKLDKLKEENKINQLPFTANMDSFISNSKKQVTFNGNFSSALCNMTTVQKMAATDGGYAVGRVATARKKRGAIDIAFKMAGMLYLNFVAPKQIEKILSWSSKQLFNLNIDLDPKILNDEAFAKQVSENSLKLPKSSNMKDILDFIDNPANKNTLFVKYSKELKIVSFLENSVRDPRYYVNEEKITGLRDNLESFMNETSKIKSKATEKLAYIKDVDKYLAKTVKRYFAKAKAAKTFNIISNVAISSYLLACVLPDVQYFLREKILGTKLEPDLI